MKRNLLLGIAAVATLLVGCTKDLTDDKALANGGVERGPLVTKSLVLEDSRLAMDDAGKFSWSKGDKVAVILKSGDTYQLDPDTYTVDHINATIEVPENAAYLIYPHSIKGELTGTTLHLNLPQSYELAAPEDIFNVNPMKGVVTSDYVAFKNLVGYAKVPLKGSAKLSNLTLKTDNHAGLRGLSHDASLDITKEANEDGGGISMSTTVSARSYVRVNFPYTLDLSTSPTLYIPVPAGTYDNLALVAECGESGTYAIYGSAEHTIARSEIKGITSVINLDEHKAVQPVSLCGTGENSYDKYANTYIVPPTKGEYSIQAILTDGTELEGGVSAEILWSEKEGLVYDLHYNPATKTISFKTNGEKGNALVVLTSNNFTAKSIVWSWLLWCTDQPKDIVVPGGGSSAGHRYTVMDRVIGATWAPTGEFADERTTLGTSETFEMNASVSASDATDACGTYYQYQNMIPYPRLVNIDHAANGAGNESVASRTNTRVAMLYGFHEYAQIWATSGNCGTVMVDDNGQYRTNASYQPHYQYAAGNNLWCFSMLCSSNSSASGVANLEVSVTGGTAYRLWRSCTSTAAQMSIKTNHDPCPAGYAIDNSSATYHYGSTRNNKFGYVRNPQDDSSYKQGYRLYGMYLNGCWVGSENDANKTALYFPCGANRTGSVVGGKDAYGNMGYIYVVNTSNNNNTKYTYNNNEYTLYHGACLQYGATGNAGTTLGNLGYSSGKTVNAQGYHVRCRKAGH